MTRSLFQEQSSGAYQKQLRGEQAMDKLVEIFCDVDGALGKAALFLAGESPVVED
ncbi:hypothetical protein [Xenorhabdus indica]|uniref:hypothetical protein n=1 Tax=Xenorhabdus indica TaxID=333964 RepID=UPI001FE2780C|nr:hypothetical protein [Xenorhabdus indica]